MIQTLLQKHCGNCNVWLQFHEYQGHCRLNPPQSILGPNTEIRVWYPKATAFESACRSYGSDGSEPKPGTPEWEEKFNPKKEEGDGFVGTFADLGRERAELKEDPEHNLLPQLVDDGSSIICSNISGGADYFKDMPRRLTLVHNRPQRKPLIADYLVAIETVREEGELQPDYYETKITTDPKGPTDLEFRAILDWMMCSDPWPVVGSNQSLVETWIERESIARGYSDHIDAYHKHGK